MKLLQELFTDVRGADQIVGPTEMVMKRQTFLRSCMLVSDQLHVAFIIKLPKVIK